MRLLEPAAQIWMTIDPYCRRQWLNGNDSSFWTGRRDRPFNIPQKWRNASSVVHYSQPKLLQLPPRALRVEEAPLRCKDDTEHSSYCLHGSNLEVGVHAAYYTCTYLTYAKIGYVRIVQVVSDVADTRTRRTSWRRSSVQKLLHAHRWVSARAVLSE